MNGEGSYNESSGQYTEMRGFMQREAASMTGWIFVRPDFLPIIHFIVGQPILNSQSRLISSSIKSSKSYHDSVAERNLKFQESNPQEQKKSNLGSKTFDSSHSSANSSQTLIETISLLKSFDIFPPIVYLYTLIAAFFTILSLSYNRMIKNIVDLESFIRTIEEKHPRGGRTFRLAVKLSVIERKQMALIPERFIEDIRSTTWKVFQSFFLHLNLHPTGNPNRILWLSFSFFILFFVVSIGLNLVSVEQVAEKQKPKIRTIEDLLHDEEFTHLKIIAVAQLQPGNSLRSSAQRPRSDLNVLYQRVLSNGMMIDMRGGVEAVMEMAPPLLDELMNGSSVLALEEYIFQPMKMICYAYPSVIEQSSISDPFDPGTLNWVYSNSINPELLEIATFHHLIVLEMGAAMKAFDNVFQETKDMPIFTGLMQASYNETAVCLDTLSLDTLSLDTHEMKSLEKFVPPINFDELVSLLVCYSYFVSFSFIVLFMEMAESVVRKLISS